MKKQKRNQSNVETFRKTQKGFAKLLPTVFLMSVMAAHAQTTAFWNPQQANKASDGSGNWDDTTVSNWWNGSSNVIWSAGVVTNAVIGAGVPGTYNITNIGTINALTVTFSNANGYTVSGSQLTVNAANLAPAIISLPNSTNTIASIFKTGNGGDITNAPNSELILSGGGSSISNPRFEGQSNINSTVVLNGGTYAAGVGTMQVSGITLDVTNGTVVNGGGRVDLGRNQVAGQSTAQAACTINVFNGQFNANTSSGNNSGNHLQISRAAPAILNVYPGGLVTTLVYSGITTPNSSPSGNLRIVPDSGSQGTLNVLGGTVLVGLGAAGSYGTAGSYSIALTELTMWDTGPGVSASSRAILNMTGGSITANEILLTEPASGITSNPTNGINITGGTLYVGTPNISFPSGGLGANFFFNLSGGTIATIQNWSPACSAPINLTNVNGNITFQTADINGSPFNMAFSGALTGQGGFNLIGGGALTLSGANNYSGATVISNGTLAVQTPNSPASGPVTLEGASLATGLPVNSIQPLGGGRSWTLNGNLTYDTGVPTADFNFTSFEPGTTVAAIQVNGNLDFNVTPQVTVEGSDIPDGSYPLIHYTGTLSGTPPSTVVLSGSATAGYIQNNTATKTVNLVITGSTVVSPITWAVGNGTWNTTTPNWDANGASVDYSDPDPVTFNDTASGPFPIAVSVASGLVVNPGSIMVSAANNYAITGPGSIGGSGKLTKSGAGTLTLSGTNTYSGGTTIVGGALNINYGGNGVNNSAIGTGPLTLDAGAQFGNSSGQSITLLTPITENWNGDSLTFLGTNNLNLGTGPVTLGSALVQLDVVTNDLEIDGQIGDGGLLYGIEKLGDGSLTLSNANTFSGDMIVAGGTLNINTAGAVGQGTLVLGDSATIDNQSGAPITLNPGPGAITMSSFTFLGTTNLDLGSATITVENGTILNVSNNTLTVDGSLNGSSSGITKNGPGAFTIDGSGSSGSVSFTINGGTVNADRGSGTPAFGVQQAITINTNGALVVLNPTGDQFNQNILTLNGGLLELNGDSGETLNGITFNSGTLSESSPTTAQLNLTAGDTVALGGVANFDVTNGGSLIINGIVTSTNSQVVLLKTGGGVLTLATNMSYLGNTTISNGTLSITYPDLQTNGTVTIDTGAVLNLDFTNDATNIVGGLVLNGTAAAAGIHNATTDPTYLTGIGTLLVIPPVNFNLGTIQFNVSGTTLNLAWPANPGWSLQVQTNSFHTGIGANWVTVPGSVSVTNLAVPMNPTNGATFYRLMYNP